MLKNPFDTRSNPTPHRRWPHYAPLPPPCCRGQPLSNCSKRQNCQSPNFRRNLSCCQADAYGHGILLVARTAIKLGASWLGTALLEEAVLLRQSGLVVPGGVIAWLTPPGDDFETALKLNIDHSVSSIIQLSEILDAGEKTGIKPRVHIEVDTGMRRGGLLNTYNDWKAFHAYLQPRKEQLDVIGLWTHFARADEPDLPVRKIK